MMLKTWPVRALFNYVFKRVLGTYIKTELNLDDLDFSKSSLNVHDIEMNTYEINKLMHGNPDSPPPFKLVNMTVKSIDVPWKLLMFNWSEVKLQGIEIILMPSPSRITKARKQLEKDNDENNKGRFITEFMTMSFQFLTSHLILCVVVFSLRICIFTKFDCKNCEIEEEKDENMYYSEVSLSSSLVTKFLANIGLSAQDIVVKILP